MGGEIQAGELAAKTIIHHAVRTGAPVDCGSQKREPFTAAWAWTTCPACVAKAPPGTPTSTP